MYKNLTNQKIGKDDKNTMSNNPFAELLRTYEQQTRRRTPQTEADYTNALQELAAACTYAVLKKLCNVGGVVTEDTKNISDTTKVVRQLRQGISIDLNNIKRRQYALDNSTSLDYNENGDLQTVVKDKDLYEALTDLCSQTLGDGLDLVNTAVVTILNETSKIKDLSVEGWLELPYTVRRLKRKVYIKKSDTANGWEDAITTPIQEVFKAIRRDIEANRSMQIASHKYTYLADVAEDTDSDTVAEVFRRLPAYSGLADEVTDYNGKVTAITADTSSVEDIDSLISKMNLTAKQAQILQLRLSGYGYKAIATYLGVCQNAVVKTVKAIQNKCKKIGLNPLGK